MRRHERTGAMVVGAVLVVGLAAACSDGPDVRETAPCGLAVELMAEADPDAAEDEIAESLGDEGMDKVELADTCTAMVEDLCTGPTSQRFDQPLRGCSD